MPGDASASPPLRRRRPILIYLPAAVLLVALVGFSGGWWWAQGKLAAAMDSRAAALRQAGWAIGWRDRTITGFPFRLKVVLTDARALAPGEHAWGLSAPRLEAQAYLVQPTHWVFAAAQGLTIRRPMGGPLVVSGQDLRASVAGVTGSPWRLAFAGDRLAFSTPPDAAPFSFTGMDHFEAHVRPSSDGGGDGDVLVEVDGGKAAPGSVAWNLAQDAPVDIAGSGRLLKLSAARGADAAEAIDAWSKAGGALRVDKLAGVGGRTHVSGNGGLLGVGAGGRLEGALPLMLRQDPVVVGADGKVQAAAPATPADAARAAADQGGGVSFPVSFKDGRMRLGPVDVGPAPMIR